MTRLAEGSASLGYVIAAANAAVCLAPAHGFGGAFAYAKQERPSVLSSTSRLHIFRERGGGGCCRGWSQ